MPMEKHNIFASKPSTLFYGTGISILLLIADRYSGPFIQFPITYLIPVTFVCWFNGSRWGFLFAIVMPLVRLYFNLALWSVPWNIAESITNCVIRIVVLSLFAFLIDRIATHTRHLTRQVDLLEGLLPICSFCKRIRDKDNEWHKIENYITERTDATFTHGVCPDCLQEHYGQLLKQSE
jgi:hypothetical protein